MNNTVVASAISSFNNSALMLPHFLWSAIFLLPIFYLAWNFATEAMARYFPVKKKREYNFVFITEILVFLWLILDHGNWLAIRDGIGFLPYLNSIILFLLSKDIIARLIEQNPKMPSWWFAFDRRMKKWIKFGMLLVAIEILAISAPNVFSFEMLQVCAILFGVVAGYFRCRSSSPINYSMLIIFLVTIGIALQPEFFRFGQMGRMTIIHLIMLAGIVKLSALIFVFRNFSPSDFIKENHYKYIKWFMQLSTILAFIVFVMTESVPVLLGFGLSIAITTWFAIKHMPKGASVSNLSNNLWAIMLVMFGVITTLPIITILGLFSLKNNNITKAFFKNLRGILN